MKRIQNLFSLCLVVLCATAWAVSPLEMQWAGASYEIEDGTLKVTDDSTEGGLYLVSQPISVDFTRPWKLSVNLRCVIKDGRAQAYARVCDKEDKTVGDFGTQSLIDNSEWTWISTEIAPEQWPSTADHVRILLLPADGPANALGTSWYRDIQFGPLEARLPIPGVENTKEYLFKRNRVSLLGKNLNFFPYENAPADCRLEIYRKAPAYAQAIQFLTEQDLGDSIQIATWTERTEEYGAFQTLPLTKIPRGYQADLSQTGAWRKMAVVFSGKEEVVLDDVVISRPAMAEENWKAWWIWFTRDRVEAITVFLRKSFHLDEAPVQAMMQYRYDDGGETYINGKKAGTDVTSLFQAGENVISCYVTQGRYAAGYLAEIDMEFADGTSRKLITDKTWRFYPSDAEIRAQSQGGPLVNPPEGWKLPGFDDSSWRTCVEICRPPWGAWGPIPYQPYARRTPMSIVEDPRPETIQAGRQYTRTLSVSTAIPCELPTPVTVFLQRDGVVFQTWQAGIIPQGATESTMSFSFALTQFIQPGEYQLKLVIPNYDAVNAEGKSINISNVTILNDRKAETPDARIKRNEFGVPTLTIDGKPYASIFSARLKTDHEQHTAMFSKAGLHLYHAYLIPSWPKPDTPSYLPMDALAESFLQGDPEAKMVIKIELRDGTPGWYLQLHPEDAAKFDTGRASSHVSLASTRWQALVDDYLRGLIRHVAESPYADHVIGYMVCEGEEGQWMHYWGGENPQDPGVMSDYSQPMLEYFRKWLDREYGTDEALQNAWNDDSVTLATAQIPTREERIAANMSLRLLPRDRKAADFGWALSDVTSEGIDHYARLIKEVSGGKALTGALYGHLMDLGSTFLGEQTGYARQRLAVTSPYVDYYLGPISYSHRFRDVGYPGGYDMPSPGTLELHNKIWINENDLRTHLQFPAEYAYSVRTPKDTSTILAREFARALCLRSGYYLYALGEGGLNWYDDPETIKTIAELRQLGEETISADRSSVSQIATFFDDEAQCRLAQIGCGQGATVNGAAIMQREAVFRIGGPVDEFLQFDLANPRLKEYRLYILLNPYHLKNAEKEAVRNILRRPDASVLFTYLPGIAGDNGPDLSTAEELTGMTFQMETKPRTAWLRATRDFGNLSKGEFFGDKHLDFGPTAIPSGYDEVLAEFTDGTPAVVRKGNLYLSLVAHLPVEILREMAEKSGVYLYSKDDIAVYACKDFAAFHSERNTKDCLFRSPEGKLLKQLWPLGAENDAPQEVIRWRNQGPETRIFQLINANQQ